MLEENSANKKKLLKAVKEFRSYIDANQSFIPNYGDRYRHDETITTAVVESTVNYVVSKRFVNKQQMRCTQRGAHLLLQTRVKVLSDKLRGNLQPMVPWDEIGGARSGIEAQPPACSALLILHQSSRVARSPGS